MNTVYAEEMVELLAISCPEKIPRELTCQKQPTLLLLAVCDSVIVRSSSSSFIKGRLPQRSLLFILSKRYTSIDSVKQGS